MREAQCACGELRVVCDREPAGIGLCHCQACQRRTGSAFGLAAFFPAEAATIHGASSTFVRPGESGSDVEFHFCPGCGSSVYWLPFAKPGVVAVAVGAFADPQFPAPTRIAHEEQRQAWLPRQIDRPTS
jgi:hypothetical protein